MALRPGPWWRRLAVARPSGGLGPRAASSAAEELRAMPSARGEDAEAEEDSPGDDRIRRMKEMDEAGFLRYRPPSLPSSLPPARPLDRSVLTDSFGRVHTYLRVSLTERCNLRCTYCMPDQGVQLTPNDKLMSRDEAIRLVSLFAACGVDKVRLTGGEPTLASGLPELVRAIRDRNVGKVALTSNGVLLGGARGGRRKLEGLRAAGLTHLNVSLDTLDGERFERMCRRPREGLRSALRCIEAAADLGFDPVKVNMVVMKGSNDDEVVAFVDKFARLRGVNVRFIEWMPFDGNVWSVEKMEPYLVTKARIEDAFGPMRRVNPSDGPSGEGLGAGDGGIVLSHGSEGEGHVAARGAHEAGDWASSDVAKDFALQGMPGTVSFVTSMTDHFCAGCNRIRLLADGHLKTCLFGADETDLLTGMRSGLSDEQLAGVIHAALQRKRARHAGMHQISKIANRAMVRIGG